MNRRDFIKKTAAGAAVYSAAPALYDFFEADTAHALSTSGGMGIREAMYQIDRKKENNIRPVLRSEIRNNPRAVFLVETHVDARRDESGHFTEAVPQLNAEGNRIGKLLFRKGESKGGVTFIKPNCTRVPEHCFNRTTGVYSSPDFIAGMVEHLYDLGNTNVAAGESPIPARNHRQGGIYEAFDAVEMPFIEAAYDRFPHYEKDELNWRDTRDSIVWKKIPYFRPVGDDDCMLINIATLKSHLTALTTLSIKNLQGVVPKGYGQFCTPAVDLEHQGNRMGINFRRHFHRDFFQRIEESWLKHRSMGYKRWGANTSQFGDYDAYRKLGGYEAFKKAKKDREALADFMSVAGNLYREEMWIQRGLDNADTIRPDLNIIEGIIGLDGNEHDWDQVGRDQLVNIVVAGCSPYEVDAVGNLIMGQNPLEVWYMRTAKERGLGENDPEKIDIYWIRENGDIEPVKNLAEIKRHPLGTNWQRKVNPSERLFW